MRPEQRLDSDRAGFDEFASSYDADLHQGISISGENKDYFSRGRIEWLARCLERLREAPRQIMDYGCGTGTAAPFFQEFFTSCSIIGVDISDRSLDVARRNNAKDRTRFLLFDQYTPKADLDLVFCNGVFHHIPLAERAGAVHYIHRALRPGGFFAFWENNPWNPGTRYVMSRIPFDRDAIPVSVLKAHKLLRDQGFTIIGTHFLFLFPRALRWFRPLEPLAALLPLGAQYQVLCRK